MKKTAAKKKPKERTKERRKSIRKEVLETFQIFVMFPSKGPQRVYLKDLSAHGLGIEGDALVPFTTGEKLKSFFYVNPSVKIPLDVKVMRIDLRKNKKPLVGFEIVNVKSSGYKAYANFVEILEQLQEFVSA